VSTEDFQHIKVSMDGDVALVEILSKNLIGPELAQELGAELNAVAAQDWARRILVDFHRTAYLSSTGFGVLFKLVNDVRKAGRQVKFCNMHEDVRIGADIIGLGKFVEFHESQKAALGAFSIA
jgi:anti-sigma B factor antagonist